MFPGGAIAEHRLRLTRGRFAVTTIGAKKKRLPLFRFRWRGRTKNLFVRFESSCLRAARSAERDQRRSPRRDSRAILDAHRLCKIVMCTLGPSGTT